MHGHVGRVCAPAVLALLVAGCGGGGDEGSAAGTSAVDAATVDVAATAPPEVATEQSGSGSVRRSAGQELLPELVGVPLPDGATLRHGYASGGIASQQVDLDQGVEEVVAFYRDQLPAAGFSIDEEGSMQQDGGDMVVIAFTTADGGSGHVTIQEGTAATTQVSLSLLRPE